MIQNMNYLIEYFKSQNNGIIKIYKEVFELLGSKEKTIEFLISKEMGYTLSEVKRAEYQIEYHAKYYQEKNK